MSHKNHINRLSIYLLASWTALGWSACTTDTITLPTPEGDGNCPAGEVWVSGKCVPNDSSDGTFDEPDAEEPEDSQPGNNEELEDEPLEDEPLEDEPLEDEPLEDEPLEDEPLEDEPLEDELEEPGDEPVLPDAAVVVTPNKGVITIQDTLDASLQVVLAREPSADVQISVRISPSDIASVSESRLVFTKENWNEPQRVVVKGSTEKLPDKETPYEIILGSIQSEDALYQGLADIQIHAVHYRLESAEPGVQIVNPKSLDLDKTTAELLLLGKAVTLKANLDPKATDQTVYWDIENVTDKVAFPHLVNVNYDMEKHTVTLKSNVVLNSQDCASMHLDYARTLKVTAKHSSGLSASATVELKPYLPTGLTLTELKEQVRDFNTPGYKNKTPKAGIYEKGELGCRYYDDHTTQVLIKDMNDKFVDPYVYKVGDSKYGTRASVLGAARFLVTQFPKDVPYASSGMFTSVPMTVGRYTMTSYNLAEDSADYKANYRIFGLNLTDKAYNSFSSFKDSNVIMGGKGQTKIVPWGCMVKDNDGKNTNVNGLRCSGFVSWALRNGRFYLSDWGTVLFAKSSKCKDSKGNYQRNYKCKDYVNNTMSTKHSDSSNSNGKYESAYAKFSQLKEEDFVKVSSLTKKSEFKAGDLLWSGTYQCEPNSAGKCTNGDDLVDAKKCTKGNGHVAMILGISRNEDKTIKYVYVAEATGTNGNRLKAYSISNLKDSWKESIKKKSSNVCSYKDTRLIKMDNVYNYYHTKDPDKIKEDLNTYKYTELWF